MNRPDPRALRRLVAIAVAVAALWSMALLAAVLLWSRDEMSAGLAIIDAPLVAAAAAVFLANHALRFLRWHLMLRAEGYAVPWARSLAIFMAGLALLPTPAKAGVAVRSLLLLDEGVPGHVSLAAYFVERLLDFVGLVMLASLLVGAEIAGSRWIPGLLIGATALAAIVMAAPVCRALRPRVTRWPALARAIDWLLAFLHDAAHMLGGWRLPAFIALGMAANALTGGLVWLAVGAGASPVDPGYALGVIGVAHLSGSITLLPGGIGGFEAAMMAALAAVGVAPASALAAVAIVRITTLWGSVVVGLPLLVQGMRRSGGGRAAAIP